MEAKKTKADIAVEAIDKGLEEAAAITIEQALEYAIANGSMDIKEAELCLEAYIRAFKTPIE